MSLFTETIKFFLNIFLFGCEVESFLKFRFAFFDVHFFIQFAKHNRKEFYLANCSFSVSMSLHHFTALFIKHILIEVMARGCQYLAAIWQRAWKASPNKIKVNTVITEKELMKLYLSLSFPFVLR